MRSSAYGASIRRTKTRENRTEEKQQEQKDHRKFVIHEEERGGEGFYRFYQVDGELQKRSPEREHTVVLRGDSELTFTNE
ncbi:unnamed protein product, partial [Mesorhabditis spiculigera]